MSEAQTQQSVLTGKRIIWVYLSGAMALTFVAMLFVPFSGAGDSMLSVYATMLWCGIFGASLARYRDKSGWIGFAAGSVTGMLIHTLSLFF